MASQFFSDILRFSLILIGVVTAGNILGRNFALRSYIRQRPVSITLFMILGAGLATVSIEMAFAAGNSFGVIAAIILIIVFFGSWRRSTPR